MPVVIPTKFVSFICKGGTATSECSSNSKIENIENTILTINILEFVLKLF